jgi:hypothetical protein
MNARLDVERLSSLVILFISLALVIGFVAEYTQFHPDGSRIGTTTAGAIIIAYGLCAIVYLVYSDFSKRGQ